MFYLSASGHFSNFGLFDCFNVIIGSCDTLLIDLIFLMGDVWFLNAYLKFYVDWNIMIFYVRYI